MSADEPQRITEVDLTRIDGVDVMVAQTLVSEVGLDMSRWKTEAHFASCLVLCPDNRIRGDKVLARGTRHVVNRAATALRMGACCEARRTLARRTDACLAVPGSSTSPMKFVVTLSTLNAGHFQDGAEWVWQPPSIKLVTRDAPNISPPSTRRPKFRDEFPKAHSKEREFLFPILGDNIFILPHSMKSASRVLRRMLLFIPLAVLGGILQKTADAQSHNVDGTFLVDARVDGSPAVLLLDTGAEHCLLDREFAKRLGLHPIADANVQKPYSSGKNETVRVTDLEIQSIHSSDLTVMTDDLTASSGALGVRIDGVLGNDFLRKFTVTLDYSVGSITFDHISVSHHGVPINLGRVGNRYLVHLNFDGVLLSFLLDTGTNFSALSQSGWARLNQDKTVLPLIDGVRSSGTSATSKLVCIQRVTLGRNSYQNLPVRVQPPMSAGIFANPAVDGLLGSDFLMQFVVSLDLANNALYLNPDRNFTADRDRFSTIGIQFAKDPTGFFTVMAVWRPTPASEANIKVGDQILSVNGLNTIEMSQEDLSRQLHGEPGRKIQVTIRSGGDQRTLNLIIRNLLCQSPSLIVTR